MAERPINHSRLQKLNSQYNEAISLPSLSLDTKSPVYEDANRRILEKIEIALPREKQASLEIMQVFGLTQELTLGSFLDSIPKNLQMRVCQDLIERQVEPVFLDFRIYHVPEEEIDDFALQISFSGSADDVYVSTYLNISDPPNDHETSSFAFPMGWQGHDDQRLIDMIVPYDPEIISSIQPAVYFKPEK